MQQVATLYPSPEVLADTSIRWAWIQFQLKATGRSFAALAREHEMRKEALTCVKTQRYPRGERVIADALGLEVPKLFPERYDQHGLPSLYRGRKSKPEKNVKDNKKTRNTQARKAA